MKKLPILAVTAAFLATFFSCSKKELSDFNPAYNTIDEEGWSSFYLLPMVITPNGDHINDDCRLYRCSETNSMDEITSFYLEIKKNGKKVYSTDRSDFIWEGTDASGKNISGITEITLKLGVNGKASKTYHPLLYVVRDGCVPNAMKDFMFGDMIDARYGAIYHTMETFCQ